MSARARGGSRILLWAPRKPIGLQKTLAPWNTRARKDLSAEYIVVAECFWGCLTTISLHNTLVLESVGAPKWRQQNSCCVIPQADWFAEYECRRAQVVEAESRLGMPQTDWFAEYIRKGECLYAQVAAAEF